MPRQTRCTASPGASSDETSPRGDDLHFWRMELSSPSSGDDLLEVPGASRMGLLRPSHAPGKDRGIRHTAYEERLAWRRFYFRTAELFSAHQPSSPSPSPGRRSWLGAGGEQGSHTGRALPLLKELDGSWRRARESHGESTPSLEGAGWELAASKGVTRGEHSLSWSWMGAGGEQESHTGRALPLLKELDGSWRRARESHGESTPSLEGAGWELAASKGVTRGEHSLSW
ncbi:unnamed protein product [Closterium sp. Naga37s-1]|nr:unnamed protein product [Closterium sp. Naga37s-1]